MKDLLFWTCVAIAAFYCYDALLGDAFRVSTFWTW